MVPARWTTSYRAPATLLSDTEESVLGTEWHQDAISSLADMLREVARRLEAGMYVQWQPEADGSWHSAALDVSFQATQPFLGVRDRDGRQIELSHEVRERALRLEQEAQHVEQQLYDAERERAELQEQLQRLLRERGDT